MKDKIAKISYKDTGYFSEIITDYLDDFNKLSDFIHLTPNLEGIKTAIQNRIDFPIANRKILKRHFEKQYASNLNESAVRNNIDLIDSPLTFTICTAHQPSLFTGTLYFIYKILHAIKLAEYLKNELPHYNFVPVFWMGSEDADLDELGMVYLRKEKLIWNTNQKGAVGRMSPKGLENIIARIEGEMGVLPHGPQLIQLLKSSYLESEDIQTGTFKFIHELFKDYGLLVLIPDDADLKRVMDPVFKDDLVHHSAFHTINETNALLSHNYKVLANPREINLFYIQNQLRERIEKQDDRYKVLNTDISFSKQEIEEELNLYPERFSPNVFLRSLYQETLLPNLVFIGGGGELAYWMELKKMFDHFKVPYPILVLRNSFTLIEVKTASRMNKLPFNSRSYFRTKESLLDELLTVKGLTQHDFTNEIKKLSLLYDEMISKTELLDKTQTNHLQSLKKRAISKVHKLEKKLKKVEKKRLVDEARWIEEIKSDLFPGNGLQERKESILYFYAQYGSDIIKLIYESSLVLESKFTLLELESVD